MAGMAGKGRAAARLSDIADKNAGPAGILVRMDRQPLDERNRLRWTPREARCQLLCVAEYLSVGQNPVHHAQLVRFLSADGVARPGQLERLTRPDQAWQEVHQTGVGHQPNADESHHQAG